MKWTKCVIEQMFNSHKNKKYREHAKTPRKNETLHNKVNNFTYFVKRATDRRTEQCID